MAETAYLVRHGECTVPDSWSEELTSKGREQATRARDELVARGLGHRAYLLSSKNRRSMETAAIIGEGLGVEAIPSRGIRKGSAHFHVVKVLGVFLEQCLRADDKITADPGIPFVVVTHAPLIAAFTGRDISSFHEVKYGEVYPIPMDREDPEYDHKYSDFVFTSSLT